MGKKIIILNGSPRQKGNTAGLIEAFTKGAESSGNTVMRFDLQKMNIHPCQFPTPIFLYTTIIYKASPSQLNPNLR